MLMNCMNRLSDDNLFIQRDGQEFKLLSGMSFTQDALEP